MPYLRHFQYLYQIRTTQVSTRELRSLTNTLINIYILRLHNIMQQYNAEVQCEVLQINLALSRLRFFHAVKCLFVFLHSSQTLRCST